MLGRQVDVREDVGPQVVAAEAQGSRVEAGEGGFEVGDGSKGPIFFTLLSVLLSSDFCSVRIFLSPDYWRKIPAHKLHTLSPH